MAFTNQQVLTIRALAKGIFPRDAEIPSAADLPVTEMFLEVTSAWSATTLEIFSSTLDAVNNIAISTYASNVSGLNDNQLALFIDFLANNSSLTSFWGPFRTLTAILYYGLPPAYEAIGLPGPSLDKGGFNADGIPA